MVALRKSLTAHSDIQSQQNCPDTSTAVTLMNPFLIFVLHCHLNLRLPTTKRVGRQVRTVAPVDESPESGRGHGEGRATVFAHWPGFGCLCVDSFPGMQSWAMSWWTSRGEAAHTDTTVLRAPGCHAVLYRTVVAGVPHWQAGTTRQGLTAGRDHTALGALMNTSLRLVIHPG